MIRIFKKTVAVVALVAALVAISAPVASATISPPGPVPGHSVIQHHTASATTFNWGDAAIVAGGVLVLIGLAFGAVLVVRRGHQPASGL
jgi:hypothetical protein